MLIHFILATRADVTIRANRLVLIGDWCNPSQAIVKNGRSMMTEIGMKITRRCRIGITCTT